MDFVLGILAGILAIIILQITGLIRDLVLSRVSYYLIKKVIVRLPKRRNISGTWETEFWKDNERYTETAKVLQLFGKVWGVIEFNKGRELRKYRMCGSMKEDVLSATYEIISPAEPLDRGSFTLALSQDGKRLEGCYAWTDDKSQLPQGNKYVWNNPLFLDTDSLYLDRSKIHGKGVFASEGYSRGSEVAYFRGFEVYKDTRHSLTLGNHKIEPTGLLKYLNHHCNPNCYFQERTLVTKRQVKSGEELTINYMDTEDSISHAFKCKCQYSKCRKTICS